MYENLDPIYDPERAGRPLRIAGFMSGSGSNIVKILERPGAMYEMVFIYSDRQDQSCNGQEIARRFGLPYFSLDIRRWHEIKGIGRSVKSDLGMAARRAYDVLAKRLIEDQEADLIALGGYMSYTTLKGGVNVHPADLSIVDDSGKRVFVGDDAVKDAILAGRKELRSSTLWIDQGVDSGPLLMVSDAVAVDLPAPIADLKKDAHHLRTVVNEHQERLKEAGDWEIFPLTLDLIAKGRLGITNDGLASLDGRPMPGGIRMADL